MTLPELLDRMVVCACGPLAQRRRISLCAPGWRPCNWEITAFHEAGHLACDLLGGGMTVTSATIEPVQVATGEWILGAVSNRTEDPEAYRARTHSTDAEKLVEAVRLLTRDRKQRVELVRMVRQSGEMFLTENWPTVHRLAHALMRSLTLSRAQIDAILAA